MSASARLTASITAWSAYSQTPPVGWLGHWRLKAGADAQAFVSGWRSVAEGALATQPLAACPFLLQDEADPREVVGWWPFASTEAYTLFNNSAELKARLAPLGDMLKRIDDAVFRLVATSDPFEGDA